MSDLDETIAIINKTIKIVTTGILIFSVGAFLLGFSTFGFSAIIGALFGYMAFSNLYKSQLSILQKKKKSLFFPAYMTRLLLFAIPIVLSLKYKSHLNLIIILVCLMAFQVVYIGFELAISIKSAKKRQKRG